MSDWPDRLNVGPIGEWPGTLTPWSERKASPFSASLGSTLQILGREVYALVDTLAQQNSVELLIAIPASQFRQDGRPYARANAEHPGVILSLDSRHGHLSYPCDTFRTWQDNLRAVALALEALSKVDRYRVTRHGEQYRGFLAIESTSMPAGFSTAHAAWAFLMGVATGAGDVIRVENAERGALVLALRTAQRKSHPDMGGDPSVFQRVTLAEAKLREAGLL